MNNKEKWDKDPEYRKQVIRELEGTGTVTPLGEKEFGKMVYGRFNR